MSMMGGSEQVTCEDIESAKLKMPFRLMTDRNAVRAAFPLHLHNSDLAYTNGRVGWDTIKRGTFPLVFRSVRGVSDKLYLIGQY